MVTTVAVLAAPNQLSFEVQDEPVPILERGMGHPAAERVDYGRIGLVIPKESSMPGRTSVTGSRSLCTPQIGATQSGSPT
jgi:hypothetical protein